ncbi:MAG TPA: sialidase family protein [Candidatus Thalassarchaeaceae archaeon]|nr:sialidase family protein [Candidatus Thalassarchaeaceae archaeon]|tara:strand:- start:9358 stop:10842 length:1485 start_codon:yes stop_codon:yes gene_type:complete
MPRFPGAFFTALLFAFASFSGCLQDDAPQVVPEPIALPDGIFVTGPDGQEVDIEPLNLTFVFSSVGQEGAEPSIGITSSGCMFFTAFEKVMRSCDHGASWEHMNSIFQHPSTSDPWLWVDPVTDRVFDVQMVGLLTTWIAWSDDDGVNWLGNPHDSGPIPLNDHIKLGSGPWTDDGYGLLGGPTSSVYEQAVYFCYNKGAGIFCYTSFDGGATFEIGGQVYGLVTTNGGLHGAITTAPDGTVYVTPRVPTPTIVFSKDNGFSWEERTMGGDVGTPDPRKNSEVGTDTESNAYHVWIGADHGVYMSRSIDSGETWEQNSTRISPTQVISTTFPHIDAGDPGRIAITYLGSENSSGLNSSDIDGAQWSGNPHYAPSSNVSYYLYITYSLNALDDNPVFHTVRVSPDPVQVGSICLNSGDCRDIGGSNRNLLDFNDLHIDREGRVYVAFADGCTDACASSNNSTAEDSRSRMGSVYFLGSGPSLFEDVGDLAEFQTE